MKSLLAALLWLVPIAVPASEPQPFQRGSWAELLAAHRGRPTIVHFWGLTCGPCLAELSEWGKFRASRPDADIVMIEAEPVPGPTEGVSAPLVKAGLDTVESWWFASPFVERLEYEVDPHWRGELPFTVLVDRDGSSETVLGPVDFSDLGKWLDRRRAHGSDK